MKWSWHIWVVTDELFAKDQDYERQEGEQTLIYRMMDRNLGANDPTGSGDKSRSCLYQWGRKDPFSNATTVYGPEGNTLDMHSWPSCEGYTIDPVWNAQIGRKSGDYLYNGTVEFTLSHPATYISYADEKDISNPNQTWLRSDVPGHQNDRLWGTYFEKEAVGAATVLLSKSAFDPCPAGYAPPDRSFEVHGKRCRIVYDRGRVALRRFAAFGESLVSLCGIAFLENGRFG